MDVQSNKRILCIAEGKLFLTDRQSIPFSQTNLPPKSIRFRSNQEIFWKVAIVNYNEERAAIQVKVLDYHPDDIQPFYKQVMKKPIQFVLFTALDWNQLEPLLSFYHKIDLTGILIETKEPELPAWLEHHQPSSSAPKELHTVLQKEKWTEEIKADLLDLEIGLGEARIKVRSRWVPGEVQVALSNTYLVPEFNWIKPFFAKALGTKKIRIILQWLKNKEGLQVSGAHSPELDIIDHRLVEVVRRLHFLNRWNDPTTSVDQSLFTSDELQKYHEENNQASKQTPVLSDEDLLAMLLDEFKVRNAPQLQYLAGKLQAKDQRLRFTLRPFAGFLFFIKGNQMTHHCWELLDSHATYLWSFDPAQVSTPEQFRIMEGIIGIIREQGRQQYKQHWKRQASPGNKVLFRTIEHSYANSAVKDGFPIWRQKMEEAIV